MTSVSGTSVYIAFKYQYNPGSYRLWQVDNIQVYEGFVDVTPQVNIVDEAQVYTYNNTVYIRFNGLPQDDFRVEVFNTIGQQVFNRKLAPSTLSSFRLNEKPGIYIVRLHTESGTQLQKVIIK